MKRTDRSRSNQGIRSRKGITVIALAAAAALTLAGCAGGSQGNNSQASGSKTINLWYGSQPGQKDAVTQIISKWAKDNGVKVKITSMGPDLNPPALLPALSAGKGPDMWVGATGPGQPQTFIKGGVVKDLKQYYCKYNWGSTMPKNLATLVSSKSGQLWAVPNSVESSAMFYRKSIFQKLGIEVPTKWSGLLDAIQKLKAAGYSTPVGAAGQDGWPVTQLLGAMWGEAAGPATIQKSIAGQVPWNSSPYLKATQAFVDLARSGDFGQQANASTYQATMANFYTGKVPMTYTGSFVIPDAQAAAGKDFDDIGVFALPNVTGGDILANTSPGEGWYVNAHSSSADLAAQLLNYIFFNEANRNTLVEGGLVPNGPVDVSKLKIPSVLAGVLTEMNKYQKNGVVPTYLEGVTPGGQFDATTSEVQKVLAGQATAQELVDAVDAASKAARSKGDVYVPGNAPKC